MKSFILWLVLMVAVPTVVFATKIKDIDVSPKNPKVGDTVKISVKTSGDVARAVIEFSDLNAKKDLGVIGKNIWGISVPVNNPGEKKFKVLLYQKKKDKDPKDTEKDKFVVSAKGNSGNNDNDKTSSGPESDKQKPVVTGFNINKQTSKPGEVITISYTVSDSGGSGLKQVELWRSPNNSDWAEIKEKRRTLSGNSAVGSFTDSPTSPGTYYYGIHVVDNKNNWNGENGPKRVTVDQAAQQQYGSVSGKVHKNSASGPVLSGVLVNCGGKSDTTDGNGNFKIDAIQAGNQEIIFSKSGYDGFSKPVTVKVGLNINDGDRWLTEAPGPIGQYRPNLNNSAYSAASGNPFAKAGYGGQCTAFAWGRALEVTGNKLDTTKNAREWFNSTRFTKGNSPKQHSIVVWGGDKKNPYGHVAFVEEVDNKGNIIINEANFRKYKSTNYGGGYDGSSFSLSTQQIANRSGAGNLLGYIYLDGKSVSQSNSQPQSVATPNVTEIRVNPTSITAGQAALFKVTTDHSAAKVVLRFTDAGIDVPMGGSGTNWSTNPQINNAGNRPFTVTAYDKNGKSGNTKSGTIQVKVNNDTSELPPFQYITISPTGNRSSFLTCDPQCVDFVKKNSGLTGSYGNAREYVSKHIPGFGELQTNGSKIKPKPGDILVWRATPGNTVAGHVAIVKSINMSKGVLVRVAANETSPWCGIREVEMPITGNSSSGYKITSSSGWTFSGWRPKQ